MSRDPVNAGASYPRQKSWGLRDAEIPLNALAGTSRKRSTREVAPQTYSVYVTLFNENNILYQKLHSLP